MVVFHADQHLHGDGVLDSSLPELSCHCQVMDNLVTSLSKYTLLLHPGGAKPAVEFGNSEKARMACQASFQLANRCAAPHWRSTQTLAPVRPVLQYMPRWKQSGRQQYQKLVDM